MYSSQFPAGDEPPPPPKRELQIQGPRPSPLKLHSGSHKIKKPPHPPRRPLVVAPQPPSEVEERRPVIIYAVSPKVIHADEANFMAVVQRLTGLTSGDFSRSGDISPAARLASTEKTSPSSERERDGDIAMGVVEEGEVELGGMKGILSPAPSMLSPVPSGFFSPVSDPHTVSLIHDLSPFWHGNSSPSSLFSGHVVSPILSPDLFTLW